MSLGRRPGQFVIRLSWTRLRHDDVYLDDRNRRFGEVFRLKECEEGGNRILQNARIQLPDYTALQARNLSPNIRLHVHYLFFFFKNRG